jgi:hypothetical protein
VAVVARVRRRADPGTPWVRGHPRHRGTHRPRRDGLARGRGHRRRDRPPRPALSGPARRRRGAGHSPLVRRRRPGARRGPRPGGSDAAGSALAVRRRGHRRGRGAHGGGRTRGPDPAGRERAGDRPRRRRHRPVLRVWDLSDARPHPSPRRARGLRRPVRDRLRRARVLDDPLARAHRPVQHAVRVDVQPARGGHLHLPRRRAHAGRAGPARHGAAPDGGVRQVAPRHAGVAHPRLRRAAGLRPVPRHRGEPRLLPALEGGGLRRRRTLADALPDDAGGGRPPRVRGHHAGAVVRVGRVPRRPRALRRARRRARAAAAPRGLLDPRRRGRRHAGGRRHRARADPRHARPRGARAHHGVRVVRQRDGARGGRAAPRRRPREDDGVRRWGVRVPLWGVRPRRRGRGRLLRARRRGGRVPDRRGPPRRAARGCDEGALSVPTPTGDVRLDGRSLLGSLVDPDAPGERDSLVSFVARTNGPAALGRRAQHRAGSDPQARRHGGRPGGAVRARGRPRGGAGPRRRGGPLSAEHEAIRQRLHAELDRVFADATYAW